MRAYGVVRWRQQRRWPLLSPSAPNDGSSPYGPKEIGRQSRVRFERSVRLPFPRSTGTRDKTSAFLLCCYAPPLRTIRLRHLPNAVIGAIIVVNRSDLA